MPTCCSGRSAWTARCLWLAPCCACRSQHWNERRVPLRLGAFPGFIRGSIGSGFAAALAMLCVFAAIRHRRERQARAPMLELVTPRQPYFSILWIVIFGLGAFFRADT